MKKLSLIILAVTVCIMATSCSVRRPMQTAGYMDANFVVETEDPNVMVEVTLDGSLVFSGKTQKEKNGNLAGFKIRTTRGDHDLEASGPGYVTCKKKVTLVGGVQQFWAELKKQ